MELSPQAKALVRRNPSLYTEVRLYIADKNEEWVDFSQREYPRQNRLVSIGQITHTVEKDFGVLQTETGNVILDNTDGFFSCPFPADLLAIDGNVSQWEISTNGSQSVIYRHRVKLTFTMETYKGRYEEYPLGVFLIDDISFDGLKGTVTLKLVGMAKKLMELDASAVKHGLSWYTNRPAKFLVQELVKLGYKNSSGAIPAEYSFDAANLIPTYDGSMAMSSYGRPPEWNGTQWLNRGKRTTAVLWGSLTSAQWQNKLFLGIENELWFFDPVTNVYTVLDATSIPSTDVIRAMYIVSGSLFVVTFVPVVSQYAYPPAFTMMKIFAWWGDGSSSTLSYRTYKDYTWPGVFLYREGTYVPTGEYCWGQYVEPSQGGLGHVPPSGLDARIGENIPIPFQQKIVHIYNGGLGYISYGRKSCFDYTADTPIIYDGSGFLCPAQQWVSGFTWTPYCDLRHSFGQGYCSIYSNGYLCFLTSSGGAWNQVVLSRFKLITEGWSNLILTNLNAPYEQPICMCRNTSNEDYLYIATMWYKNVGTTDSECRLWYYMHSTSSNLPVKLNWLSGATNDDLQWTIIEMIYFGSRLVAILFNRETMVYALYSWLMGTWTSNKVFYRTLNRLQGMAIGGDGYLYVYEAGSGKVIRASTTWVAVLLSSGDQAVDGETELTCGLTFDSLNPTTGFGVSAPTPNPETQPATSEGKYYLFRISTSVTDRIELADFEGMTAWDAIKHICMAVHSVAGFDENGNFFMHSRSDTIGADDYTVGVERDTGETAPNHFLNMTVENGEGEVFNYASITPYSAVAGEPAAELVTVPRPEGYYTPSGLGSEQGKQNVPFVDFVVDQRDNLRKTVKLICTTGGKVDDLSSRWKYLIVNTTIKTHLVQATITNATTYYPASLFGSSSVSTELNDPEGIQIGDFLKVLSTLGVEVIRRIDSINSTNTSFTTQTSANPSENMAINSEIEIIKCNSMDQYSGYTQWSDEGVAYVTSAMTANNVIQVNTVENVSKWSWIYVDDTALAGNSWDGLITSINYNTTRIYVIGLTTQDNVGDVIRAWFSPYNQIYGEVGGSKVFLQFIIPTTGTENMDWTKTCFPGDTITITCPGLSMQSDEQAKQTSVNLTSKLKYGKRTYPDINNKFVSRRIARQLAGLIVSENSYPRPIVTPTTVFRPDIRMVNSSGKMAQVRVVFPDVFPARGRMSEPCEVRSISHDLVKRTTTLVLKSRLAQ